MPHKSCFAASHLTVIKNYNAWLKLFRQTKCGVRVEIVKFAIFESFFHTV